jgi:hypothetical protein
VVSASGEELAALANVSSDNWADTAPNTLAPVH